MCLRILKDWKTGGEEAENAWNLIQETLSATEKEDSGNIRK